MPALPSREPLCEFKKMVTCHLRKCLDLRVGLVQPLHETAEGHLKAYHRCRTTRQASGYEIAINGSKQTRVTRRWFGVLRHDFPGFCRGLPTMVEDDFQAMDSREVAFARPSSVLFCRAMKEGNVGPFSEGAHGFSKLIAGCLRDLIHPPGAGVQEKAAHHPAQILGRGEAVVSQLHRFLDEPLNIGWDLNCIEKFPNVDGRDTHEPLPIESDVAV